MKRYLTVLLLAVLVLASFAVVEGKNHNIQQNSNVNSEIKGGHHNTIVTDVDQLSQIEVGNNNNIPYGQLKKTMNFDKKNQITNINLNQVANIDNQIIGGNHNTIVVGNKQVAVLGGSLSPTGKWGSGNLSLNQTSIIQNRIIGGNHNVILIGSIQEAYMNAMGNVSGSISQLGYNTNQIIGGNHNTIIVGNDQIAQLGKY